MNRKHIFFIQVLLQLLSTQLAAQTQVDVIESTLKVNILGEEIFYFGFAEGDKMIFNFEETNGKELKEVEIVELPGTSKFIDYKTSRITNKTILVHKTGIYRFRFTNSGITPRICKYKIQRIPASAATQNFNPIVYTHLVDDTTYVNDQEDILTKTDTVISNFQDRILKIVGGNKSTFNFLLPENTVAWSYYITADKEGTAVYEKANKEFTSSSASVIAKFPLYTILSAVALGRPATIPKLQAGEDINYWIMDGENVELFTTGAQFRYIKKGKAVNDYSKMDPRKGSLFFCLSNDNETIPVTVTVKITAVQVNEALVTTPTKRMIITQKNKMYLKN
ncbi:MAG: hypothetical protein ABIR30_14745 [Chitinophagaceae bacterium]